MLRFLKELGRFWEVLKEMLPAYIKLETWLRTELEAKGSFRKGAGHPDPKPHTPLI